ncbi:hypothetical protein AB0K09_25350, partial [Streptomyces sp. NPDC049577]
MTGEEGAALRALARAHGGVVVTARVLADAGAGWTRRRLNRVFVKEGWRQLWGGVWVEPGRAVDAGVLVWANQLSHPQLVVSHWSAAVAHGIEVLRERVDLIGPPGSRANVRGGRLHRLALGPGDVVTRGGLPVTAAVRTVAVLLRAGPR